MIIKNGKRYVRADGEITGVIEDSGSITHGHRDPDSNQSYTKFGSSYFCGAWHTGYDLVSEYVEPCIECGNGARIMPCPVCSDKPEPSHQYGPWIPWAGGECPVADGVMGQVMRSNRSRDDIEGSQPVNLYSFGWRNGPRSLNIIYYRVLIEEPEATVTDVLINGDGLLCGMDECGNDLRHAKVTVQGDKLGIEWATVEEKNND